MTRKRGKKKFLASFVVEVQMNKLGKVGWISKEWIISWNDEFVWMLRKPFERERERERGWK